MKKILVLLIMSIAIFDISAQTVITKNFSNNKSGTVAQKITGTYTILDNLNLINWSSDTLVSRFYDMASATSTVVPTYTTTPIRTFVIPPILGQDWLTAPNNPQDIKFNYGMYVRTTKKGIGTYTTTADPYGLNSYTVAPSLPPIIEGSYH